MDEFFNHEEYFDIILTHCRFLKKWKRFRGDPYSLLHLFKKVGDIHPDCIHLFENYIDGKVFKYIQKKFLSIKYSTGKINYSQLNWFAWRRVVFSIIKYKNFSCFQRLLVYYKTIPNGDLYWPPTYIRQNWLYTSKWRKVVHEIFDLWYDVSNFKKSDESWIDPNKIIIPGHCYLRKKCVNYLKKIGKYDSVNGCKVCLSFNSVNKKYLRIHFENALVECNTNIRSRIELLEILNILKFRNITLREL